MKKIIFYIAIIIAQLNATPIMDPQKSLLESLQEHNLWHPGSALRLHLGCGLLHLDGYINIDFPPSKHTVQSYSGADIFGNITLLKLPLNCITEIRSHHTFEHFDRQSALALLTQWSCWLKKGGVLFIETPDFQGSIEQLCSPAYSYAQKQLILRHLTGSHEAPWAIHCDGWYKEKFEHILQQFGFGNFQFYFSEYCNLKSIKVIAQKLQDLSFYECIKNAGQILRENMIDDTEEPMWQIWIKRFDNLDETIL